MGKKWKQLLICACIPVMVWSYRLVADRRELREGLIRFHVVAHSDAPGDQAVKLRVRDAVLESIGKDLQNVADMDMARQYLRENLPKIRNVANQTLRAAGFTEEAAVSLCREAFDVRNYDTFSLPAGVYESLRIVIGDGQGQNWWCVAFPELCVPATAEVFAREAENAGFSESLTGTLMNNGDYEIRFFLLDALGQLENILLAAK